MGCERKVVGSRHFKIPGMSQDTCQARCTSQDVFVFAADHEHRMVDVLRVFDGQRGIPGFGENLRCSPVSPSGLDAMPASRHMFVHILRTRRKQCHHRQRGNYAVEFMQQRTDKSVALSDVPPPSTRSSIASRAGPSAGHCVEPGQRLVAARPGGPRALKNPSLWLDSRVVVQRPHGDHDHARTRGRPRYPAAT